MRLLALAAWALLVGCSVSDDTEVQARSNAHTDNASTPVSTPLETPPERIRRYAEPTLGLRVPVPAKGVAYKLWDYDKTLPVWKYRHQVILSIESSTAVVIDVWDNPDHLDANAWVDATISKHFDEQTLRSARTVAGRPALVFEQLPSEGLGTFVEVAFTTRDHGYDIACPQADNPAHRALFEKTLRTIEVLP